MTYFNYLMAAFQSAMQSLVSGVGVMPGLFTTH